MGAIKLYGNIHIIETRLGLKFCYNKSHWEWIWRQKKAPRKC